MPQGLALAASEWAKIGEFVRGGGKIDGKPLVDEMAFGEMFEGSQANPAYGLTWWLPVARRLSILLLGPPISPVMPPNYRRIWSSPPARAINASISFRRFGLRS